MSRSGTLGSRFTCSAATIGRVSRSSRLSWRRRSRDRHRDHRVPALPEPDRRRREQTDGALRRRVDGPGERDPANIHVVTWKTPEAEAAGMARRSSTTSTRTQRTVTSRWSRAGSSDTGSATKSPKSTPTCGSSSGSRRGCWSPGRRGRRSSCSASSSIPIGRRGGHGSAIRTPRPERTSPVQTERGRVPQASRRPATTRPRIPSRRRRGTAEQVARSGRHRDLGSR